MVCKVQRNYGNIKLPMLFVVGEDDANAPSDTVITSYRMTPYAD
jgi:alpha/beta hydrolase family protein